MTEERIQQLLTVAMHAVQQQQTVETRAFSKVGSAEAEQLLWQVGISEIDGHELEPIVLPADVYQCSSFDFSTHRDENAGTPALLRHHQAQLAKLDVKFGRGGYTVYDLHARSALYKISASAKLYQGCIDGCVAPHGLQLTSAAKQCRVAYEHKQSPAQKLEYRLRHPEECLGKVEGSGDVRFAGDFKGQSVTALVGAYAYNAFPLLFDLTDGRVHHMLHVRGKELYEWTNLTPTQAYYLQAKLLTEKKYMQLLTNRTLELDAIPEELQRPMKMLRSLCSS